MQKQHRFGWINKRVCLKSGEFNISPLQDFDVAIREVIEHPRCDAWLEMPPGCNRFELPPTHSLEVDSVAINDNLASLLISLFGFLHGLNLKPSGVGHLHRTPHQPGTLVKFMPSHKDIEKALKVVIEFYQRHSSQPEVISLMVAAIHWYLTSQAYHHHFEQFAWQYTVLENVIKTASKKKKAQVYRQQALGIGRFLQCEIAYRFCRCQIVVKNAKALVECRNKLMHEALWCDQPIGYTVNQKSYAMLR